VVVVWTGRPDGGGRPGMTGREAALPLMFDVFDLLQSGGRPAEPETLHVAPDALQQMANADAAPPRLLFPPDGARLQLDAFGPQTPGLSLSALGRGVRWYVDGAPILSDGATGQTLWRPRAPGFYSLAAVDDGGRRVLAHVRVER
jgi:penicillin-binding protein 1C